MADCQDDGSTADTATSSSSNSSVSNKSSSDADVAKMLPIRMVSKVIKGFGRGSADLGIPTANLCKEEGRFSMSFDSLPTGIYWGFARIGDDTVYKAAVSIGYNPYYGNETKTIEPHLIAPPHDERRKASSCGETVLREFYGETIRLTVVGYLRPELPFEGLEKLIEAIKNDIIQAEALGDQTDKVTLAERTWAEGNEAVSSESAP